MYQKLRNMYQNLCSMKDFILGAIFICMFFVGVGIEVYKGKPNKPVYGYYTTGEHNSPSSSSSKINYYYGYAPHHSHEKLKIKQKPTPQEETKYRYYLGGYAAPR